MRLLIAILVLSTSGLLLASGSTPAPVNSPPKASPSKAPKVSPKPVVAQPSSLIKYTFPGIIGPGKGGWIGSDHLLGLSPDIHVNVDIIKPANVKIGITSEDIKKVVLKNFEKQGFNTHFVQKDSGPPLPYFNIEIILQVIDGGYVASVEGRLFEAVTLKRVVLPEEVTFQAITWEKQNMIVTPTDQLNDQITKSTEDITNVFISRYVFFEREKKKQEEQR